MLRLMSATLAFLVFGAFGAQAEATKYHDPEGRFNVTVPDGWQAEKPALDKIALFIASPRSATLGAACLVMVSPTPETRASTQAEIDAAFAPLFTQEFWTTAFQAAGLKDVAIESSGSKDQNGRKVYFVIANVTTTGTAGAVKAKGKQMLHVIPGSLQFVNCAAKAENYAELDAEFESIFNSYEPKSGEYIARAPQSPPAVLTLYSGPQFNGVTRVVQQDTPNLPLMGWSGVTASFAVAGFGQWEFCDGVNYAGNCKLVAGAQTPITERIGSVRRYLNPRDMRGALSLVAPGAGAAVNATLARTTRK
jgi:hypothetical protein